MWNVYWMTVSQTGLHRINYYHQHNVLWKCISPFRQFFLGCYFGTVHVHLLSSRLLYGVLAMYKVIICTGPNVNCFSSLCVHGTIAESLAKDQRASSTWNKSHRWVNLQNSYRPLRVIYCIYLCISWRFMTKNSAQKITLNLDTSHTQRPDSGNPRNWYNNCLKSISSSSIHTHVSAWLILWESGVSKQDIDRKFHRSFLYLLSFAL